MRDREILFIKDLIGKCVTRFRPYYYSNGVKDNSYIDDKITIISLNDNSFTCKENSVNLFFDLDKTWDDGNWTITYELV